MPFGYAFFAVCVGFSWGSVGFRFGVEWFGFRGLSGVHLGFEWGSVGVGWGSVGVWWVPVGVGWGSVGVGWGPVGVGLGLGLGRILQ